MDGKTPDVPLCTSIGMSGRFAVDRCASSGMLLDAQHLLLCVRSGAKLIEHALRWASRDSRTHKTIRCRSTFTSLRRAVFELPSVPIGIRNVRNQSKER
jgi:hypothetical protein